MIQFAPSQDSIDDFDASQYGLPVSSIGDPITGSGWGSVEAALKAKEEKLIGELQAKQEGWWIW